MKQLNLKAQVNLITEAQIHYIAPIIKKADISFAIFCKKIVLKIIIHSKLRQNHIKSNHDNYFQEQMCQLTSYYFSFNLFNLKSKNFMKLQLYLILNKTGKTRGQCNQNYVCNLRTNFVNVISQLSGFYGKLFQDLLVLKCLNCVSI